MEQQFVDMLPDFIDMGRIPDVVKEIPVFDGKSTELVNWLIDVQSIFERYRELNPNSTQYTLIEKTVRRRIRGEAADVLNANNVTSNWHSIKNTLLLYYKDKRDLKTLDFELTSITKSPKESLGSYFSRVNDLLSHIITQLQTDERYNTNITTHIDYFKEKALDSFIRGLEKPLSINVKLSNPSNLSRAYQICLEFLNMDARAAPYRNNQTPLPPPRPREEFRPMPPPVPARRFYQMNPTQQPPRLAQPIPEPRRYHAPEIRNFPTPQPRRLPPPEPMEIDQSIRSRNLNYGNRPPMIFKRPHPPSNQIHRFKKQAHPLELDENYSGYYYTDSPEYYPDGYDYLDTEAEFYARQQQQHAPQLQYYVPPDIQKYKHEPQHMPVQIEQQANDVQAEQPIAADELQNSAQSHFLEWKPRW